MTDFLKKIELKPQFEKIGKRMRKMVIRNLMTKNWKGPKQTGVFTKATTGRTEPGGSLLSEFREIKPKIKKRGVSYGPSRAKRFKKINFFIRGWAKRITRRQQVFLRAKGVREGTLDPKVMFFPSFRRPFKVGADFYFQPKRDPFHYNNFDAKLAGAALTVAEKVLFTWGFR